jgi:SecD/SecF fusion protein
MAVPEGPGAVPDAAGKEVPGPAVGPDGTVVLTFSEPTSRNYVQDLLDREFRTVLVRGTEPARFTLTGDESTRTEGRYRVMTLNVSEDPAFDQFRAGATPDPAARARQLQTLGRVLAGVRQAFDSTPEPERLEVFDSQLAGETRMKAFYAILASWIAILLYLWFRFGNWTFGLAAVLCLIHDLCFVLGAIAACHYLHHLPGMHVLGIQDFKIDLAAVAALLTLVGFSVNDTIVVFDRIREVRGKNPRLTPEMIDESVNQTLSRTILTATTVFLVSIVLYIFGGESIHLFAFVMVVGVLVGTYSSIFVAAPLLLMFGEGDEGAAADAGPDEPADRPGKEEEEVVEG